MCCISNEAKRSLLEATDLMGEGLALPGDFTRQRQNLQSVARRCRQSKLLVLNWLQSYFADRPVEKPSEIPSQLISSELKNYFELMEQTVSLGLTTKSVDDLYFQQQAVNKLVFLSFQSKVPILEWLALYFSKVSEQDKTAQPVVYRCPNPNCDFETTNRMAYVGHGPNRCMRKSRKNEHS